jgi:hypothetical protein
MIVFGKAFVREHPEVNATTAISRHQFIIIVIIDLPCPVRPPKYHHQLPLA